MKNQSDAQAWMADAIKWGNKTYMPFSTQDLLEIFTSYERALDAEVAKRNVELEEQREHFIKEKAELTGRIGGLQKQLAKLAGKLQNRDGD